jgi:hypothetical protein
MQCPHCASQLVFRSRSADHAAYRLVLCTKLRCHYCGKSFLAPLWQTAGRVVDPPPRIASPEATAIVERTSSSPPRQRVGNRSASTAR